MANPLSRVQVISIINEATPKLALPEEEIDALFHDLNWTLSQMGFYVDIEAEPAHAVKAVKAVKRVLRNLKVQSQSVYVKQLLKSVAFHHIIKRPKGDPVPVANHFSCLFQTRMWEQSCRSGDQIYTGRPSRSRYS